MTSGTTFNEITVVYGTGSGSFATRQNIVTGLTPLGLAIGDLDNNGQPDIVVTNFDENTISLLFQPGGSGTTAGTAINLGTMSRAPGRSAGPSAPISTQRFFKFTLTQSSAINVRLFNLTSNAALTVTTPGGTSVTSNRPGTGRRASRAPRRPAHTRSGSPSPPARGRRSA